MNRTFQLDSQGARTLKQLGFGKLGAYGVSSTQHHSYLPDGSQLGAYGRSLHDGTKVIR